MKIVLGEVKQNLGFSVLHSQISPRERHRLLRKLALEREVRGDTERRTGVYTRVHEDSSTVSTKQFSSEVEFPKKSNKDSIG